jgi:Fe-S oxidoreductase
MAGAFGYETEHYDLSMTIGDELEAKIEPAEANRVAAPGASCGQQLEDRNIETEHPMELLAEVVA